MTDNRQQLINAVAYNLGKLVRHTNDSEEVFREVTNELEKIIQTYRRKVSYRTIVDLHDEDEDDEL